jgi:hypothetical protein
MFPSGAKGLSKYWKEFPKCSIMTKKTKKNEVPIQILSSLCLPSHHKASNSQKTTQGSHHVNSKKTRQLNIVCSGVNENCVTSCMEGCVLSFLKQNERWATQAQPTEPLVCNLQSWVWTHALFMTGDRLVWAVRSNDLTHWATWGPNTVWCYIESQIVIIDKSIEIIFFSKYAF